MKFLTKVGLGIGFFVVFLWRLVIDYYKLC